MMEKSLEHWLGLFSPGTTQQGKQIRQFQRQKWIQLDPGASLVLGWLCPVPHMPGCSERKWCQPTTLWSALCFSPRATELRNLEPQVSISVPKAAGWETHKIASEPGLGHMRHTHPPSHARSPWPAPTSASSTQRIGPVITHSHSLQHYGAGNITTIPVCRWGN